MYNSIDNPNFNNNQCESQEIKYNYFFNNDLKKSFWFGIFDLDEFLYCPIEIDIKNTLKKYENQNQIKINRLYFNYSEHFTQPINVVEKYCYRSEYNIYKFII